VCVCVRARVVMVWLGIAIQYWFSQSQYSGLTILQSHDSAGIMGSH